MKTPVGPRVGFLTLFGLFGAAVSLVPACTGSGDASSCVVGVETCACTSTNQCDPGLSCQSGVCLRGGGPGPNMSAPTQTVAVGGGTSPAPVTGADGQTPLPREAGFANLAGLAGSGQRPGAGGAKWTIFFYGHGDHSLSPSLLRDIAEMSQAKIGDNVQFIALVDWNAKVRVMAGGPMFPPGAFWYRITGNGQEPQELGAENELDFDDPTILASAIEATFKQFPADRYGVILWDHGGAWRGGFGGDNQDNTRERAPGMAVDSVASAVRAGLQRAGLGGVRPLDIFGFDTCLMSGVEVIPPFADLTKVFIANAELDYGDGFDYTETLTWLSANASATGKEFAVAEAAQWDEHHRKAGGMDTMFRSHAVWDTEKFGTFMTAMKTVSDQMRTPGGPALAARGLYLSFPGYFSGADSGGLDLRDIGNILETLKGGSNLALSGAASRAYDAALAARLAVAAGDIRKAQLGLHVYGGPVKLIDPETLGLYPRLAGPWERATGWGASLNMLRAAMPATGPTVTATATVTSPPKPDDAAQVAFQITGDDTAYVEGLLFQARSARYATLFGSIAHGFIGAGEHALTWDGKHSVLVANPENLPVSLTPWAFTAQGQTYQTPYLAAEGVVQDGESALPASLLVDPKTGGATNVVLDLGGGRFRVFTLAELAGVFDKAVFVPTLQVFDLEMGVIEKQLSPTGVYIPANGTVQFGLNTASAGAYILMLRVADVWGNNSFKANLVQLGDRPGSGSVSMPPPPTSQPGSTPPGTTPPTPPPTGTTTPPPGQGV